MLKIFTIFANWLVYGVFGLEEGSKLGESLHFFIEDVTKIYFLLVILIYVIGYLRATLNIEAVRTYLSGKHKLFGYFAGAGFGAITPFCSCSSIPLFLGFTQAKIPIGITMSFLITSPIINEVAIALLGSLLGAKFMVCYVLVGIIAGVIGGTFFDLIKAERFLTDIASTATKGATPSIDTEPMKIKMNHKERCDFAKDELKAIFGRVWKWVLLGVGLGAALHGYVPESFITDTIGKGQWWSVPAGVLLGIPLYSNASGIIPIAESLINKGLPIGTTLAFMMSTVAASMPEFIMLKQVMQTKLLLIFFGLLLVMFTIVGWIFNYLW